MACLSPLTITDHKYSVGELKVRCGKCPKCKERTLREWIFRLVQEGRRHLDADFITLTYDSDHIPISKHGFKTLKRQDFTLFMKRLRKNTGLKLKYFACGEYGSKNKRPHYHAIVYGNPFKKAYQLAWALTDRSTNTKIPIGETHVGTVNQKSIAYVCKYLDKPSEVGYFKRDDRVKEFRAMSQNLGLNYLTDRVKKYHKKNLDKLYVMQDGFKVPMPKYYRDQLYSDLEKQEQLTNIISAAMEKQRDDMNEAQKQGITYIKYISDRKDHIKRTYYKNKKSRD